MRLASTVRAAEFLVDHRWHVPGGPAESRREPGTYTWTCPCLPVSMTFAVPEGRDDEDGGTMRRASGEVPCADCGLPYRDHPVSWHRSWDGQPYLHRLCDGGLVHL